MPVQYKRSRVVKNKKTSHVKGKKRVTPNVKWRTWVERLQIFTDVVNSLHPIVNGDDVCLSSDQFGDAIKLGSRIGSPSKYGEVHQAFLVGKEYKLAVKKVELLRADQGRSYTERQFASGYSAWAELAAYMLATILALSKICNNLPLTYKYTLCKRCHFVNKKVKGNPNKQCILVINEYAEGDLKSYLQKSHLWSLSLVNNCVFQIAAGLYAMEKYFRGMTHNDLHYGNVLVHEIARGGYWEYKIDGKRYYLPNLGYVFVLWDFGMVDIPGRLVGRPMDPNETDIGQISELIGEKLRNLLTGKRSVVREIVRLEGLVPLTDIIHDLFAFYRSKPTKGSVIDQFNMDASVESVRQGVPASLRSFLTSSRTFKSYSA